MKHESAERCAVCGQEIQAAEMLHAEYEGERRAFCSRKCQAVFERDPEQYVGETQVLGRQSGYT